MFGATILLQTELARTSKGTLTFEIGPCQHVEDAMMTDLDDSRVERVVN